MKVSERSTKIMVKYGEKGRLTMKLTTGVYLSLVLQIRRVRKDNIAQRCNYTVYA